MANTKGITKKEILDKLAELSDEFIKIRKEEVKSSTMLKDLGHDTVLNAIVAAVSNDVYKKYVRPKLLSNFGLSQNTNFIMDGKPYTIADALVVGDDIVCVYFRVNEDGTKEYYCEKISLNNK